jgi:glycosyltransferase involved in cell wall biosynthesis
VPEGDPAALAARVAHLLGDPATRERMGREAVRWAAEHRWPCVAEAICKLYSELQPAASLHLEHARCHGL